MHFVDFVPTTCFGQGKKLTVHGNYLCIVFFYNVLNLTLIEQQMRGNLEQSGFLINGFIIGMIICLDDLYLFLDLTNDFSRPILRGKDHYCKFRDAFNL